MTDSINQIWGQQLGTRRTEESSAIAISSDGSIIAVGQTKVDLQGISNKGFGTSDDGFILKYQPDGTIAWTRLIGSQNAYSNEFIHDVVTDEDGNIYITGTTQGSLDTGDTSRRYGNLDGFIAKLDSEGNTLWAKSVTHDESNSKSEIKTSIGLLNDGDIVVSYKTAYTGPSGVHKFSNSGVKYTGWGISYDSGAWLNDLVVDKSNNVYVGGYAINAIGDSNHVGGTDALIVKVNASGNLEWQKLIGTNVQDEVVSITISPSGENIFVTGNTDGNLEGKNNFGSKDVFISQIKSDGSSGWLELLGTEEFDEARSIAYAPDNSLYISGWTNGTLENIDNESNNGLLDCFFGKYSLSGSHQWTFLEGSSANDEANGITATESSIIITCTTGENISGTNSGNPDIFQKLFNINSQPSYDLSTISSSLIEGDKTKAILSTSGIDTGTKFYWMLEGNGISNTDFSNSTTSGSAVANEDGIVEIDILTQIDSREEVEETADLIIYSDEQRLTEVARPSFLIADYYSIKHTVEFDFSAEWSSRAKNIDHYGGFSTAGGSSSWLYGNNYYISSQKNVDDFDIENDVGAFSGVFAYELFNEGQIAVIKNDDNSTWILQNINSKATHHGNSTNGIVVQIKLIAGAQDR